MTKVTKHIIIMLFLFAASCVQGQDEGDKAQLDLQNSMVVGKVVTIPSQFRGLPVVEPHISAHPLDKDHLLAAAMVVTDISKPYQSCRLSSFVSQDGGQTWTETAHDWWGYDPWTAILPDGQTVMTWLGTRGSFQHQFPVQFFSSSDGGISWEKEVQTAAGGHDGTKVTALGDAFYFTTVRFRGHGVADVIVYGKKGNEAFEEVARIDAGGQRLNFCEPAILTDGAVLVPASHYLRKVWVQRFDPGKKNLSSQNIISLKPGGARGYMRMAADVSPASPYTDQVYFVRALGRGPQSEGIWLNISKDKGRTWTRDTRIDLFDTGQGGRAMLASVAVNKDGMVGISWVDAGDDPSKPAYDVYFTISRDGGLSFQRPERITHQNTNPRTEANGDVANKFAGGGHYLGLTARADGGFQLIWSDSRSGIFELQTCNVKIN